MNEIHLSDAEIDVARFLAQHFREKGKFDYVAYSDFPNYEELGEQQAANIAQRFKSFGWVGSVAAGTFKVEPAILDIAYQLDNPPPKDYWKRTVTWFRSNRWSVPFVLILIVLPLLVQWVEMIKTLLRWVRILE